MFDQFFMSCQFFFRLSLAPFPHARLERSCMESNFTDLRQRLLGQKGMVLWFSGLSGAGKSTIAEALLASLLRRRVLASVLDGDCVREGLCKDLGFSIEDRRENLRRLAEISALMVDAGAVVITAFISPLRASRELAREIIGPERFIEIHIATSIALCEERDVKGLYKRARAGDIPNFTGISSPFEEPEDPDLVIDTGSTPVDVSVRKLETLLEHRGAIQSTDYGL